MKVLTNIRPTKDQLRILSESHTGFTLIRGGAGSGKTTTALLRLSHLIGSRLSRRERLGLTDPVRVLVLTYNRTLAGYIAELAHAQNDSVDVDLVVSTFAKWALHITGSRASLLPDGTGDAHLRRLARPLASERVSEGFLVDEAHYAMNRLLPTEIDTYVDIRRTGRGTAPRMERSAREELLNQVIHPYMDYKRDREQIDWNDLAVRTAGTRGDYEYDVVVVDETQDMSANQIRAVMAHLDEDHSTTFIMDAIQRIYPQHFSWTEVGINWTATYHLSDNHRNTRQIAEFAIPLVSNLPPEDDGTIPSLENISREGRMPTVVAGRYSEQLAYMVDHLLNYHDLSNEQVAILHPRGGRYFAFCERFLRSKGLQFVSISSRRDWPTGPERIALSTLHSAKGLEFDHVLMPGLSADTTSHDGGDDHVTVDQLRRLLAMGITRAKLTVSLGYKPGEASDLLNHLDPSTYDEVDLGRV